MTNLQKYTERLEKWLNKQTPKTELNLQKLYAEIIKEILVVVGSLYRKYEKEGSLSPSELARYQRTDVFLQTLLRHINTMSKRKSQALHKLLQESFAYSYDWMSWAIQKEAKVEYHTHLEKEVMHRMAMENPVTGLTLSDTLNQHRAEVIQKVRIAVKRGIANKVTYKEMADALTQTFENDYKKAVRVARTETHRVREQATLETVKKANEAGIVMAKKWLSMRDERVRRKPQANHVTMHGQTVPVNELFDLGNGLKGMAPGLTGHAQHDINCRCITTYTVLKILAQTNEQLARRTFEQYQDIKLQEENSLKETVGATELEVKNKAINVIPNFENRVIDDRKLYAYALNESHIFNEGKAVGFNSILGYNQDNWEELKINLEKNLANSHANKRKKDQHGERYEVITAMTGPSGKTANVLTGWVIGKEGIPKLTTLYIIGRNKAENKKGEDV